MIQYPVIETFFVAALVAVSQFSAPNHQGSSKECH